MVSGIQMLSVDSDSYSTFMITRRHYAVAGIRMLSVVLFISCEAIVEDLPVRMVVHPTSTQAPSIGFCIGCTHLVCLSFTLGSYGLLRRYSGTRAIPEPTGRKTNDGRKFQKSTFRRVSFTPLQSSMVVLISSLIGKCGSCLPANHRQLRNIPIQHKLSWYCTCMTNSSPRCDCTAKITFISLSRDS